jgi:RNA polymerase sigma factor (sigma-70 family)
MNSVLRHLNRAALGGLTDGQLLEQFLSRRDEAAFEALVRRHGPMVLGVCRRVLRSVHDAEDAFQATFLVLARKAASLRARELLGNWLYGVAYRTAMKARTMNARRRAREERAGIKPTASAPPEDGWEELLPLLDQELSKLPDKYRVPVVLCDLEGKSRREVARHLNVPEGTVSSRLATARRLLAGRLARYGLTVSGGALAAGLSERTASACVTSALAASTARAAVLVAAGGAVGAVPARAVTLAEGVIRTMFLLKLRTFVAVVVVAFVGAGVVGLAYRTTAAEPGKTGAAAQSAASAAAADDLEALRLEVEALRKRLDATRQELKDLKAEVRASKVEAGSGAAPKSPGADTRPLPPDLTIPADTTNREAPTAPVPGTRSGAKETQENAAPGKRYWSVIRDERAPDKPDGGDPLAEAEAALKKLRERPDDRQAADSLERALQRLKEREKSQGQPGYRGEAK